MAPPGTMAGVSLPINNPQGTSLPNQGNPLALNPTRATPIPAGGDEPTMYERLGGHDTFVRLVHRFYQGVAADETLRAMYPEQDLGPAEQRLRMFLEQYWGGPRTYHEQRGHPRLRMRHVPFAVTPAMRDRWLTHMRNAVDSLDLDAELQAPLWEYLEGAANFMVNSR